MKQDVMDLLNSKDPMIRVEGIERIIATQHTDALKRLMQMYKSDPDATVRQKALEGINALSKALETVDVRSKLDPTRKVNITETVEIDASVISVSASAERRAERRIDAAQDALTRRDMDGAVAALRDALQINPNLRHDSGYQVLIQTATGMNSKEAMGLIENVDRRRNLIHGMRRRSTHQSAHEESKPQATWAYALRQLVLATLWVALLTGGVLLAVQQLANFRIQRIDTGYPALSQGAAIAVYKLAHVAEERAFAQSFAQQISTSAALRSAALITGVVCLLSIIASLLGRARRGDGARVLGRVASLYAGRMTLLMMVALAGSLIVFMVPLRLLAPQQALQATLAVAGVIALITLFQSFFVAVRSPSNA